MQNRAIISTHHKSGTVWMAMTFRAIAGALGLPCHGLSGKNAREPVPRSVCFVRDIHSQWFDLDHRASGDRVLHVIRDPRDIVISAMHYHRKAPEKWLHRPDERFGGKSYQQALNDLSDDKARYIFEMDYGSAWTIRNMCAWPYGREDCFETKYETLLADGEAEFTRAVRHLGLRDGEVDTAVDAFLENSLASGSRHKRGGGHPHIRSGAPEQWRAVYDDELRAAFMDRFPEALLRLGYEPFRV